MCRKKLQVLKYALFKLLFIAKVSWHWRRKQHTSCSRSVRLSL